MKTSSQPKIHIDKMTPTYYDDDYVIMIRKTPYGKTYKYTLDLRKKIVELYMVEEGKVLTYHKCHSSNKSSSNNDTVIKNLLKMLN